MFYLYLSKSFLPSFEVHLPCILKLSWSTDCLQAPAPVLAPGTMGDVCRQAEVLSCGGGCDCLKGSAACPYVHILCLPSPFTCKPLPFEVDLELGPGSLQILREAQLFNQLTLEARFTCHP